MPTKEYFIKERAKYLTHMLLTRSKEFVVRAGLPDSGLDFVVDIAEAGQPTGRVFAVIVKTAVEKEALIRDDGRLRWRPTGSVRSYLGNVPFPVCVVAVVSGVNDEAYFAWAKTRASTSTELGIIQHPIAQRLDRQAIELMIQALKNAYSGPNEPTPLER